MAVTLIVAMLATVTMLAAPDASAHAGKFQHEGATFETTCPEPNIRNGVTTVIDDREVFGCVPVGFAPVGPDVALCEEASGMLEQDVCTFDRPRECDVRPDFRLELADGQCLRPALVEAEFAAKPVVTVVMDPPTISATRTSTATITLDYTQQIMPASEVSIITEAMVGATVEQLGSTCTGDQFHISGSVFSASDRSVPAGETCTFTLEYTFAESGNYQVAVGHLSSLVLTAVLSSERSFAPLKVVPLRECDGKSVTIDMNIPGTSGVGTAGDDVILGTIGNDVIDGAGGNDTVCAREGDDVVIGGDGDDKLIGGPGRDIMRGNSGADILDGGPGLDRLLGGIDGDSLNGGDDDDFLGGFGGDDTITGGDGNDVIFGGFGADTINGGDGDDVIRGLIGDDIINGGNGNDQLDGDRGNDTIGGGPGDDVIRGGNAADILNGNGGADSVSGGKADDILSGGPDTGDTCVGNDQIIADFADLTCEAIFGVP